MSVGFLIIALSFLVVIPLVAIYSHKFDDNLLQRIGLSCVCLGSVMWLSELARGQKWFGPSYLLVYGFSIFAVGTAWKIWRNTKRKPK